jgi:hypothetical protein
MKILEASDSVNGHDLTASPCFIEKDGKLIGMIRRSDFNNLYPSSTDRNKDFDGFPNTLRLSDVIIYLESKGYKAVIQ